MVRATARRREQRLAGQRLGDMHDRAHAPVHFQRRIEMTFGRTGVAAQRRDPGEVSVTAAEERDELAGH